MYKDRSTRKELMVGGKNVLNSQLVSRDKIIRALLHKKLVLIKQFVKALDKFGLVSNVFLKNFLDFTTSVDEIESYVWNSFFKLIIKLS